MSEVVRLGPFDLYEPIGQGGHGQVWRGRHRQLDVEAAIKVLGRAFSPNTAGQFAREVRAVARLDHPGIVVLLDYGAVGISDADASDGALIAGASYLAMEYASLGTLSDLRVPMPWAELKALLLALLDALAHAHARGVIHRDIKPGNVLLAGDRDLRPGLKLTDFGIAHAMGAQVGPETDQTIGTPAYMAPEQIESHFRDYGPWTDLYALGCLAHYLATGRTPFEGSFAEIIVQHVATAPPAVPADADVPEGFQEWLSALLAKSPAARPRCAADAAWALHRLGGQTDRVLHYESRTDTDETFMVQGPTVVLRPVMEVAAGALAEQLSDPGQHPRRGPSERSSSTLKLSADLFANPVDELDANVVPIPPAPMPRYWARSSGADAAERGRETLNLTVAGLPLFGLRSPRLVGRERERDALWHALMTVRSTGSVGVVVLHGQAGVGRSRLLQWLCRRSFEVGAATIMRARRSEGRWMLAGLLRDHFGTAGLTGDELRTRIAGELMKRGVDDPRDVVALAEIIAPGSTGVDTGRVTRPDDWCALVRRTLASAGTGRAVLVAVDDAHEAPELVWLTRWLLQRRQSHPVPALIVLDCNDEIHSILSRFIDELRGDPDVSSIDVPPLSDGEMVRLVRDMLHVTGPVVSTVVDRARGNPRFAVQLVTDWVERDLLQPSRQGLQLIPNANLDLPDTIHAVASQRIEQVVQPLAASAIEALEIAAALGMDVDETTFALVCARAGLEVPTRLTSRLFDTQLAVPTEQGWSFTGAVVPEALRRHARDHGRSRVHHGLCAAVLEEHQPDDTEAIGRHLAAAGQHDRAATLLLDAAEERIRRHSAPRAEALLERATRSLDAIGEHSKRRARAWVLAGLLRQHMGDIEDAVALGWKAGELSRQHGWPILRAQSLEVVASVKHETGDLAEAESLYRDAIDVLGQRDLELHIDLQAALGMVLLATDRRDDAHHQLSAALQLAEQSGAGHRPRIHLGLARVLRRRGSLAEAERSYRAALALWKKDDNPLGIAVAELGLAEVARESGDLERAYEGYLEAISAYEAIDSPDADVSRLNAGLVRLEQSRHVEARRILEGCLWSFRRQHRRGFEGIAHVALLAPSIAAHELDAFQEHLGAAEALLATTGVVDPDVARCLELARHQAELAEFAEARDAIDQLARSLSRDSRAIE